MTTNTYERDYLKSVDVRQEGAASGRVTSYTYDAAGHKLTQTDPDPDTAGSGLPAPVTKWEYDTLGQVTAQISTTDAVGAEERRTTYTYDKLGRKLTETLGSAGELRGYWELDDGVGTTASDSSGVGNPGTLMNGVQWGAGQSGGGLVFDGVDDYVRVADSPALDGIGQLTLSFWVKPTALDGQPRGVISKRSSSSSEYAYSVFFHTGNKLYVDIDTVNNRLASTTVFAVGTWYHIAVAFDGTAPQNERVKLYVNGQLDATGAESSTAIPNYASDLLFGILDGGYPYKFAGALDDVRVYGRALGESEIQSIQTGQAASELPAPVTRYTYDANGNVTSVVHPLGNIPGATASLQTVSYQYDALNRRVKETGRDQDGSASTPNDRPVTTFYYDVAGNLVEQVNPLGDVAGGNPAMNKTSYEYDLLGRMTKQTAEDQDGNAGTNDRPVTQWTYDANGNVLTETDALDRVTSHEYDALGRATKTTLPDLDTNDSNPAPYTTTEYDVEGNVVKSTDELGAVTQYQYSPTGQQTRKIDADADGNSGTTGDSPTTNWTYNAFGELVQITDPVGNITSYTYDNIGRQRTSVNDLSKTETTEYDAFGNVLKVTDRNGRTIESTYDKLNRKLTETWKSSGGVVQNTITYAYDVEGRLTSISDGAGTWAYTYDSEGRMLTADNNGTANMPRTIITNMYDIQGRRTSQTTSVAGVTQATDTYSHDALGRLVSQTQTGTGAGGQAKGVKYAYRADGSYDTITRYSDATFTTLAGSSVYGYDDAGNLTSLVHKDGLGTSIATYSWTYDASGRITNFTSPAGGSKDYTYDANDQVKTATGEAAYSYDNAGNRTMTGYVTGDDNRLTDDGVYTYQYDDEGNRTRRTSKSDSSYVTYAYDQRNRLTEVTFYTSGGTKTKAIRYVYDANDQRIRRELDATGDGTYEGIEKYTYNGDDTELVLDGNNNLVQRFMQGSGIDQALTEERIATGEVYWLLADHQGSIRDAVTINPTTHMVQSQWSGDFDTFGNLGLSTPNDAPRFTYAGRESDGDAGLYYYRARWYDQTNGRFLSQDPKGFGAGDANLYRYVGNNAINMTDPDGMMAREFDSRDSMYAGGPSIREYAHLKTMQRLNPTDAGRAQLNAISSSFNSYWDGRYNAVMNAPYDQFAQYANATLYAADTQQQLTHLASAPATLVPGYAKNVMGRLNTMGYSDAAAMSVVSPFLENARVELLNTNTRFYSRGERLQGSGSIIANTLTFGLTDWTGATNSKQYVGRDFDMARDAVGVSREAGITLATAGASAAYQAGRGLAYGGLALAGEAYSTYQNGASVYAGVQNLREGNLVGALQVAGGAVGLKGNLTVGRAMAPRLGADAARIQSATLDAVDTFVPWANPGNYRWNLTTAYGGIPIVPNMKYTAPVGGTYKLVTESGTVVRTGRTGNLLRREAEHRRMYEGLEFKKDMEGISYAAQRGREQIIHDRYRPILNKVRPISPNNGSIDGYMAAGRALGD